VDNRIRQIEVHDGPLIPAQAEVWITVTPEHLTATTELRGRLIGPSCPYASTVEVAYPLRTPPPSAMTEGASSPAITMRAVIPEASLWEPESPFLYQGPIELWQDGQLRERVTLSHGLRHFALSERGLRVNSRPITLRGRFVTSCSEVDARTLHQAGYNLLVVPVEASSLPVWERADRFGLFILGQILDDSELTLRHLESLRRHTSCLGWLIEEGKHPSLDLLPSQGLLGLTCGSEPSERLLREVHFLVGPSERANFGRPLLVTNEVPISPSNSLTMLGHVAWRT
jgi:hypothetical protein